VVNVETTLTLPHGLTLQKDGGDTFNMMVYFQSSARVIDPQSVKVLTSGNVSYSFNVTLQLNIGEQVTFYTNWTANASEAGAYNVSLLAVGNDPMDPNFRCVQDVREVRVVEDIPVISAVAVSGSYTAPKIDAQATYLYPDRDLTVQCNASSAHGMKNVTIYYSTDQGVSWTWKAMTEQAFGEWATSLPRQADGTSLRLYVEAFSLLERSSKTRELVFQVVDLQALDVRTTTLMASTVTVVIVGCAVYLSWRRRKMNDVL
jgi:hypothetical protein